MKKFIGKPYAGKPHVRIDEGAGKGIILPALLYWQVLALSKSDNSERGITTHEDCNNNFC